MPSVTEAGAFGSQLDAALKAGLRSIDRAERITFTLYRRWVLPADGYIFWVNTGQTVTVPGSLHYGVDKRQNEDETVAVNRVVFTSEQEVQEFNAIAPGTMWVGELGEAAGSAGTAVQGISDLTPSPVLFAFSSRDLFYQKADIYHYVGTAVLPPMLSQIISNPSDAPTAPIVSDSLPVWLALQSYAPVWLAPYNPGIALFPSYAVPENIAPPYGVVHIEPTEIKALQSAPFWDATTTSHYQLSSESVRVTLYGCGNNSALDFLDLVLQYSRDTDAIGIMNMPVVRDEKRTQVELGILAQKKTIQFDVSYVQTRVNDIARQLITNAVATFYPDPTGIL